MAHKEIFENLVEPFRQQLKPESFEFLLSRGEIFAKQITQNLAGVVNLSNVVRQLPPTEDKRFFHSVTAKFIKDYLIGAKPEEDTSLEKNAMESIRDKIWEFYELRRRQSV